MQRLVRLNKNTIGLLPYVGDVLFTFTYCNMRGNKKQLNEKSFVDVIQDSLENDVDGRTEGQYDMVHMASGMGIWTANGMRRLHITSKGNYVFTRIESIQLRKAIKKRRSDRAKNNLLKGISYEGYLSRDKRIKQDIIDKLNQDISLINKAII